MQKRLPASLRYAGDPIELTIALPHTRRIAAVMLEITVYERDLSRRLHFPQHIIIAAYGERMIRIILHEGDCRIISGQLRHRSIYNPPGQRIPKQAAHGHQNGPQQRLRLRRSLQIRLRNPQQRQKTLSVQNPDGFRHLRQVAAGRIKQKEVDLAASGDLLQKIHQRPRNSSMIQIITDKKNLLLLHRFCPAFPVSGTAAFRRKSSGRYFFTT